MSVPVEGHSSNAGAIAGGIIGGIVAISVLVAALFFYLRRRRLMTPTVVFEGDIARYLDQTQLPMSDRGTLAETLPETIAPLKPYVYVFMPPIAIMCSHVFSLLTRRTRMTQRRTPSTKELGHHLPTFLVKHLPYLPTEIYTRFPPRRAPKHSSDTVACPSSDLRIALSFLSFPLVVRYVSH